MDRTGGMENAHDTLAPECTGPEARFPHRLGRHRTPPIRSTGTLVCTLEHDVTGRISSTRCETDGRKLTEQRRYAPTSVHVRRNPCSRSPDLVFTFTGLRRSLRINSWPRRCSSRSSSLSLICWASRDDEVGFGISEDGLGHRIRRLVGGSGAVSHVSHRSTLPPPPDRVGRLTGTAAVSVHATSIAGGTQRDPEGTSREPRRRCYGHRRGISLPNAPYQNAAQMSRGAEGAEGGGGGGGGGGDRSVRAP